MKLNLDFYEDKEENLSENEMNIIKLMSDGKTFDEIIESEPTVNNYIHLSGVKENLLNWYEFKENSSLLEIGSGFGELTNLLVNRVSNVVSIEPSFIKAKALEKKFKDIENLEIIVGDLNKVNIENKFDYVVITDYLENNNFCETLRKSKLFLKEEGTFLIAIDNKYGIKNWKGKDEYKALLKENSNITKKNIEKNLKELGFGNYKFYYIFPEYKAPNLIYTDDYKITTEDISRNFELNETYEEVGFLENEALKNLIKDENEIFNFFANSFLIEISNSKLNDARYITFTNYRKREKQVQTIIYEDKVIKRAVTKEAENHIKEMIENGKYFPKENCRLIDISKDEKTIESDFINGKRLDLIIENSNDPVEKFSKYKEFLFSCNKIIPFDEINKEELIEPLKNIDENILREFNFIEYGFIDMVPKNCFVVCGMNLFFDQEWMLKFVPLEYIFYRAIKNVYLSNIDELYEKFELNKYIELFEKIEDYFRDMVIDNTVLVKILARAPVSKKQKMYMLELEIGYRETTIRQIENEKRESENRLNEIIKSKDNEIAIIQNSFSWKVTKPIRVIAAKVREILKKLKKGE